MPTSVKQVLQRQKEALAQPPSASRTRTITADVSVTTLHFKLKASKDSHADKRSKHRNVRLSAQIIWRKSAAEFKLMTKYNNEIHQKQTFCFVQSRNVHEAVTAELQQLIKGSLQFISACLMYMSCTNECNSGQKAWTPCRFLNWNFSALLKGNTEISHLELIFCQISASSVCLPVLQWGPYLIWHYISVSRGVNNSVQDFDAIRRLHFYLFI